MLLPRELARMEFMESSGTKGQGGQARGMLGQSMEIVSHRIKGAGEDAQYLHGGGVHRGSAGESGSPACKTAPL